MIANVSDLTMILYGLQGKSWTGPNAANTENLNPVDCP